MRATLPMRECGAAEQRGWPLLQRSHGRDAALSRRHTLHSACLRWTWVEPVARSQSPADLETALRRGEQRRDEQWRAGPLRWRPGELDDAARGRMYVCPTSAACPLALLSDRQVRAWASAQRPQGRRAANRDKRRTRRGARERRPGAWTAADLAVRRSTSDVGVTGAVSDAALG